MHVQSAALGACQTRLDGQMEVTHTVLDTGASCRMILVYALGLLIMSIVFLALQMHCICSQDNAGKGNEHKIERKGKERKGKERGSELGTPLLQ